MGGVRARRDGAKHSAKSYPLSFSASPPAHPDSVHRSPRPEHFIFELRVFDSNEGPTLTNGGEVS
jgi:hypothetical protein